MVIIKTRIIVSAILLPVFFAVLFIFPVIILTLVISAICAIAAYELINAVKIENKRVLVYSIIAAALTSFTAIYINYSLLLVITLIFTIFFILISLLIIEAVLSLNSKKNAGEETPSSDKKLKFRQIPVALAAGMLIPIMLSSLIFLRSLTYGHLFVLLPIISAFMTDSGAYFTGVAIGRKKPFPNISPNKTVEGYVGGVITGTLGMLLYGIILSYTTPLNIIFPALIIYGITGAIVTGVGDLVFSLIKRKCGIKDYGNLIPGHGGALDRFDSMTFAAPTMFLLVIIIPAIIV